MNPQPEKTVRERLQQCFQTAFPGLDPQQIPNATQAGVTGWDSIAQVTLMSLIGEEFGLDVDYEAFEELTSFASLLQYLETKAGNG